MTKLTNIRAALIASTALASALIVSMPAAAQSLPDTGNVTSVTSGLGGGAPGSTNPGFTPTPTPTGTDLRVDLRDNRTILNWGGTGFDIAAGNGVNFKDSRATSGVTGRTDNIAVLNRDLSGSASGVYGSITSDPNVGVYLINTNGIVFGGSSVVNTGAFFASTRDVTDGDFLDGNSQLAFSGSGTGNITMASGAKIGTAANGGTSGGRMGDLVLIGSGLDLGAGSQLKATGGDVGMIVGDTVTMQNSAGSPLSFTVDAGSTAGGFKSYGSVTGSNVTMGLFTRTYVSNGGSNLDVRGPIVATGAAVTDRGVVLVSNAAGTGVTLSSTPSEAPGAKISLYGEMRIGAGGTPGTVVTSASGMFANSDYYFVNQGLDVAGKLELKGGQLVAVDPRASGQGVKAGEIAFSGKEIRLYGGIQSTSGDISFDGNVVSVESGSVSSARDILGTLTEGFTYNIGNPTVSAARNVNLTGRSLGFYELTAGGSITLNTNVANGAGIGAFRMTAIGGDITLSSPQTVSGYYLSSGGKVTITGQAIDIGTVESVGTIDLTSTRTLKLISATASGASADIIVHAPNVSWTLSSVGQFGGLPSFSAGRDVTLTLPGGVLSEFSSIRAGRNVTLTGASINADSVIATTGFVDLLGSNISTFAANVRIGTVSAGTYASVVGKLVEITGSASAAGGNLTATSTAGSIYIGSASASGDVSITAGAGRAEVPGNVTAGGNYTVAGDGIQLGTNAGTVINAGTGISAQRAGGTVDINARSGSLQTLGTLTLQSNSDGIGAETLTVRSQNLLDLTGSTLLGGNSKQSDVRIGWGPNTSPILGGIVARGAMNIFGNDLGIGLNTAKALTITGNIDVANSLTLIGSSVTARDINVSAGDLTVSSTNGQVLAGAMSASGNLNATATGGTLRITGNLQAGGNATLTANSITLGDFGSTTPLTVNAGLALTLAGPADAAASISFTGKTVSAGQINISNGDLTVSSTNGQVLVGPMAASGNVTAAAVGGDLRAMGGVTAGGNATLSGNSIELGSFGSTEPLTFQAKGALTLTATNGSVSKMLGSGTLLTLRSNSDGVGTEALTLATTGDINLGNSRLEGGPAQQSDVQLRYRTSSLLMLGGAINSTGGIKARGLLGALGNAAFTNGLSNALAIDLGTDIDLVNTLSVSAPTVVVGNATVRNGDISLRSTSSPLAVNGVLSASNDISLNSGSNDLVITADGRLIGRNVVLSTNTAFTNQRGSDAISASGHWVIYSNAPGTDTFGGLNSNNTAYWNSSTANRAASTLTGNRYVFRQQQTLVFTPVSGSKVYGTILTGAGQAFTVTGYHLGVAGAFLGDSAATAYSGLPTFTSSGYAERASVAGSNYTINAALGSLQSGSGYGFSFNAGALTVTPKALNGTITANNKTYDGTRDGSGTVTITGVVQGDTVGTTGSVFTFADKNAGTGKTVTVSGTTLNGADAGNYTLIIPATALADILRKALVGVATVNSKTYDGTTATTGTLSVSGGVIAGDDATVTGATFAFADKNAGTGKQVIVTATLTGADAGNYAFTAPSSLVADILKKAITGTYSADSKTYDGTRAATGTVVLNGVVQGDTVGTSGTTFTFADKNAGVAKAVTVGGITVLTGADAGNYTITISGSAVADILKKAITGDVTINTKTYDGTNTATGSVVLNGKIAGDDVGTSGTNTFAFADKNAGIGKTVNIGGGVTLTGNDAGNYTLTLPATALGDILKKTLAGVATVNSKTYDGTTATTGTLSVSGGVIAGDDATVTGATFAFADKNAGTGKQVIVTATLTGADAGNYTFTAPSSLVGDILKKAISGTVTANNKTYDGTTTGSGTVSLTGVVQGDAIDTGTITFTFANKNAGTGKTVTVGGALSGADAGNYIVTLPASAIADILKKAITAGVTVDNKTYDGTTSATGTVTLNGVVQGDTVGTSGTVLAFADKNAGTGKTVGVSGTTLTGADAGNYSLTIPASVLADILKKAITGSVTANSKTYDGSTAATGTVTLNGLVSGDAVGTSGTSFAFSDKNAGTGKTVNIAGTVLNGADAGNYTLTIPTSVLADILKKAITGSVTANSKTYDGSTAATGAVTLNGVVSGDMVGTSGTSFAFADKNAGTAKTVNVTGTTLSGTDAGNYTLSIPASVLADILKKAITGSVNAHSKTYDGTTATTGTVTLNGIVQGDTVGTSGTSFAFADKNAGMGKTVNVTGTTLSGADAGNYTLSIPASAIADILKKAITGSVAANNKTYDGSTAGTGSVTLNGVVSGDAVGTSGTSFTFADKNAGTGKTVSVSGTALTGADAGNYTLTLPASVLADILKKVLTANVTANSKTYDATTSATGNVVLSGVVSGETVGTTGTTFAFADKNAGAAKTVNVGGTTLTGADAGNYTLSIPATVVAEIVKKALTGVATVNGKTYDGTTATTGTFNVTGGVIAGDDATVTGATFNFVDKNAGTGKQVNVTATLTGADAGNYAFTAPTSLIADILQKAITGSVTVTAKTYDGTRTASGNVTLNGVVQGDTVGTTGTVLTYSDKNAGTGKTVSVSGTALNGTDAGNYTLTMPASVLGDILKKALTANIGVDTKTYDGTTAATGTVTLSGVVQGDTVGATGTSLAFANKNAGTGKTVNVTGGTLTGADASNYTLTMPATALGDILKKAITGTIAANGKTYDGTTAGSGTVTLSGVVQGDAVGTTGSVFTFADKNAGTGKAVSVTGTALNGADAGNYTLTLPASALADILKKAITGSISVTDKSYDGTTAGAGTVTLNGLVQGDTVGTSGTVFTFADKNAGTGKTVSISGTTLTGADAGNYTLSVPASALGNIARRQVTITPNALQKDQGQADPVLTFQITGGSLVSGDQLTGALGREAGELPGNYAILIGTLTGGGNYSLTLQPGTFMIVTRLGDSLNELQALKVVTLPSQIQDLSTPGGGVSVDDSAVCGADENCTAGD